MNIDAQTIDRIVAGVLNQLSADGHGTSVEVTAETRSFGGCAEEQDRRDAPPSAAGNGSIVIEANVVTADVLLARSGSGSQIVVPQRAIVTPAAWDVAREHDIEIVRDADGIAAHLKCAAQPNSNASQRPLMIIVLHTDAVGRLSDDMNGHWRRELSGCPDEAAELAISGICRGAASLVVIFAEQIDRAACLANRNERVKAVAVRDAGDVRVIRSQLRANVWCVNPESRSWFELKNLMRAIAGEEAA